MTTASTLPDFQGARLRQAREVRQLTATALAERVGVTSASVSTWEAGRAQPRSEARGRLAEVLELPEPFFLLPRSSSAPEVFRFRSMSAATKRARLAAQARGEWLHEIVTFLESVLDLPAADVPDFNLPSDPVGITREMIEEAAEQTRVAWGLRDGPIPDVLRLLESHGVAVARLALNVAELDGLSGWSSTGRRPYIVLNAEKASCVRSRFDATHELAHLVLHRHAPARPESALHRLMETQAHAFAGAFIFPRTAVVDEVGPASLECLIKLKERWRLSMAAQIFRLFALGLITEDQKHYLQRTMGARNWRSWEPLDSELPVETPTMIRQAYELLCDEGGWSPVDIMRRVPLATFDHESLASLPARWMEGRRPQGELVKLRPDVPAVPSTDTNLGEVVPFPPRGRR